MARLLYFGPLNWGSTSLQRMEALHKCVDHVYGVDDRIFCGEYVTRNPFLRFQLRFGWGPALHRASATLITEIERYQPNILWVNQGNCIAGWSLAAIQANGAPLRVHYTPDSLTSPGFRNAFFARALKHYDLCFTNKPHEVDLYRTKGANAVFFVPTGFSPQIHRPVVLEGANREKYGCDVAFVGQQMADRARSVFRLLDQVPCKLHLYGRQWDRGACGSRLGPLQRGWIYGDDYAKAICGAKICLGFLNREVGDTYTQRTFEIPACGGFFLGERTEMHQHFFAEDKEAVYFGSDEELVDKVKFYLAHDDARERIRLAGHRRAWCSGYTYEDRMRQCVGLCEQLLTSAGCRAALTAQPAYGHL